MTVNTEKKRTATGEGRKEVPLRRRLSLCAAQAQEKETGTPVGLKRGGGSHRHLERRERAARNQQNAIS